jgi:ADP-heptose:LPS heptosyltransferase
MFRRLLIRPGALGDFVVSLPALETLRAPYTEVWTETPNLPLVRFADQVRALSATGLSRIGIPGQDTAPVLQQLRSFDEIVTWYGSNRPEFRQAVAGLPFRFLPALPPDDALPAVDFYLQQVGCPPGAVPRLPVPVAPRRGVAIHPFSGSPRKNWPLERFLEVAARLDAVLFRGPEESLPGARFVEDRWELACELASFQVFLGNDSGVSHLAAAAGTPVIALFGPSNPAVWAPRGPRVEVLRPFDEIPPRVVIDAAYRIVTETR